VAKRLSLPKYAKQGFVDGQVRREEERKPSSVATTKFSKYTRPGDKVQTEREREGSGNVQENVFSPFLFCIMCRVTIPLIHYFVKILPVGTKGRISRPYFNRYAAVQVLKKSRQVFSNEMPAGSFLYGFFWALDGGWCLLVSTVSWSRS
jgi:hypothetical protein